MRDLTGKNVVVAGCTGGVGQSITAALIEYNASVLGLARDRGRLQALKKQTPDMSIQVVDATDRSLVDKIIFGNDIDILIIALGAIPHMAPIGAQSWDSFSRPWDTDMRATFNFCHAALNKPLRPGANVVLISGGPGLGSSPLSGGLSTAKSGQLFLADACQWQSQKENLGIRFTAIAPKRMMPTTAVGKAASEGYATYLGVSVDEFMKGQTDAQTANDVGPAVISTLCNEEYSEGIKFVLTNNGLAPI